MHLQKSQDHAGKAENKMQEIWVKIRQKLLLLQIIKKFLENYSKILKIKSFFPKLE